MRPGSKGLQGLALRFLLMVEGAPERQLASPSRTPEKGAAERESDAD